MHKLAMEIGEKRVRIGKGRMCYRVTGVTGITGVTGRDRLRTYC